MTVQTDTEDWVLSEDKCSAHNPRTGWTVHWLVPDEYAGYPNRFAVLNGERSFGFFVGDTHNESVEANRPGVLEINKFGSRIERRASAWKGTPREVYGRTRRFNSRAEQDACLAALGEGVKRISISMENNMTKRFDVRFVPELAEKLDSGFFIDG